MKKSKHVATKQEMEKLLILFNEFKHKCDNLGFRVEVPDIYFHKKIKPEIIKSEFVSIILPHLKYINT